MKPTLNVILFLLGVAMAVFMYRRFRDPSYLEQHYAYLDSLSGLGATINEITTKSAAPNAWLDQYPGTDLNLNPFSGATGGTKIPTALPSIGITP